VCGLRFKCKQHINFNLCFKCYWHYQKTHYPQDHEFKCKGEGLLESPEFIDPPPRPIPPHPLAFLVNTRPPCDLDSDYVRPRTRSKRKERKLNKDNALRALGAEAYFRERDLRRLATVDRGREIEGEITLGRGVEVEVGADTGPGEAVSKRTGL